jgi:hypothetical protein
MRNVLGLANQLTSPLIEDTVKPATKFVVNDFPKSARLNHQQIENRTVGINTTEPTV